MKITVRATLLAVPALLGVASAAGLAATSVAGQAKPAPAKVRPAVNPTPVQPPTVVARRSTPAASVYSAPRFPALHRKRVAQVRSILLSASKGGLISPRKAAFLNVNLSNIGVRTASTGTTPNCAPHVSSRKRCWVSYSGDGRGWTMIREDLDASGRCANSIDQDFILQDGRANPAYGRYSGATQYLPQMVAEASVQLSSGSCVFEPIVDFTLSSAAAAAHPRAEVLLQFTPRAARSDVPLKGLEIAFPKGMDVNVDAVAHCNSMPQGPDAERDCSATSDIGDMEVQSDAYSTGTALGVRAYLANLNFSNGSNIFMGPKGAQPQFGDTAGDPSVVGYLWLVLNSVYQLPGGGVIDLNQDDVVLAMRVYRSGGILRASIGNIPRRLSYRIFEGSDLYIALNRLKIKLEGSSGGNLISNPAPGSCSNGDRLMYSAFHVSHLDDVPWRPDIPQTNTPAGHQPTGQSYVNLAWSSAGQVHGC